VGGLVATSMWQLLPLDLARLLNSALPPSVQCRVVALLRSCVGPERLLCCNMLHAAICCCWFDVSAGLACWGSISSPTAHMTIY